LKNKVAIKSDCQCCDSLVRRVNMADWRLTAGLLLLILLLVIIILMLIRMRQKKHPVPERFRSMAHQVGKRFTMHSDRSQDNELYVANEPAPPAYPGQVTTATDRPIQIYSYVSSFFLLYSASCCPSSRRKRRGSTEMFFDCVFLLLTRHLKCL